MAKIGSRARGMAEKAKGAAGKSKSKKPASAGSGPAWKPAKSSVTGPYGKAVSAAAKAKNGPAAPAPAAAKVKTPVPPREGGPIRATTIVAKAPGGGGLPTAKSEPSIAKPPSAAYQSARDQATASAKTRFPARRR
jgi:hypothetical protein